MMVQASRSQSKFVRVLVPFVLCSCSIARLRDSASMGALVHRLIFVHVKASREHVRVDVRRRQVWACSEHHAYDR